MAPGSAVAGALDTHHAIAASNTIAGTKRPTGSRSAA